VEKDFPGMDKEPLLSGHYAMIIWTLARKDLRALLRDPKAVIILVVMPLLFILVLGVSLGEGFGQKPDDRLRVSLVDLDEGPSPGPPFEGRTWAQVVRNDLAQTGGIRVEIIGSRAEAERLVKSGKRAAVIVFGPRFSKRVTRSSFLADGINPFGRDGVEFKALDLEVLADPTQLTATAIIKQAAQGTLVRVVLPWMIGRAFEKVGSVEFIDQLSGLTGKVKFRIEMLGPLLEKRKVSLGGLLKTFSNQVKDISLSEILPLMNQEQKQELGTALKDALQHLFSKYKLTAKTWAALTKKDARTEAGVPAESYEEPGGSGLLRRGAMRYQLLVPSYTVMFAFFLVLTVGWLFVGERRQGTLKRLRAAPITRGQILLGKLLPCFLLSVGQGLLLLGAGKLVFGMSWGPDPLWLLPVVVCTALAAMGLALLVAAAARTETQVAIYGTLLVLLLAGLSGAMMGDRSLMPEGMQQISRITPHAWALDAYRQLLTSPTPDVETIGLACLALTGFGIGFLALAWWMLRLE
jgi:ABC-type Na+ efflux pump permease subunit